MNIDIISYVIKILKIKVTLNEHRIPLIYQSK